MSDSAPVVVVDASIGVKWAVTDREEGIGDAMWLLERHAHGDIVLAVPGTFRLEWLNALLARGLSVPNVLSAAHDLELSSLDWYEIDETLSFEAVALASTHSLTVYDAAYLALANRLDAGLVTADAALARAAGERLVHVVDFKP